MLTAYSYIRWSSDIQSKGDSLRRQLEMTRLICREHGWHLDESLAHDNGISAFNGSNLQNGSLGHFLKAVEAKYINTPCVLVVEALDRLTRMLGELLTTMTISVSPQPALTSTSTGKASMPLSAAEQIFASIKYRFRYRQRRTASDVRSNAGA
jgi:DNA invertase Pin-like site-specific DNA recombinase